MKKLLLLLFFVFTITSVFADTDPAVVILTAGQSNADGRVMNTDLPTEIQQQKYKYCQWSYGSGTVSGEGKFETFWPRMINTTNPYRWAFDAIVYWNVENELQKTFYVIKETYGGTAIDTLCESKGGLYWNAWPQYLTKNTASDKGGKSLLKAFTENIGACIDNQLSQLSEGYDIKFLMWHQGESDVAQADNYYNNLKKVIDYIRNYLVEKTGNLKYAHLPVIIGGISHLSKQWCQGVEDAQHLLAQTDSNIYVVDVPNATLQSDQLHFDATSAQDLGNKMYEIIENKKLLNGIAANIKTITVDRKVNVYTESGILVRRNVQYGNATKDLNSGIYIVDGKKIKK